MTRKKTILIILGLIFLFVFWFFFLGSATKSENIKWGIVFSQKYASELGFDWKEVYSALAELDVKYIKIVAYWDLIEKEDGTYSFEDIDWQIQQAEERGAEVILNIGMKTPRWPECHIPEWAQNLSKDAQQEQILEYLETMVLRYKDYDSIKKWQVENEPLFPFGACPWTDEEFVKKEIELVKSLDDRPAFISDSGEGSFWLKAAGLGDLVGITMYKKVWFNEFDSYISYPFSPGFYHRKAQIIGWFFDKEIICVELQAEPWGPALNYHLSLDEQKETMDVEKFKEMIAFAEKSGLDEFYLWGAEWWYWMKERHNQPEILEEAEKLFKI